MQIRRQRIRAGQHLFIAGARVWTAVAFGERQHPHGLGKWLRIARSGQTEAMLVLGDSLYDLRARGQWLVTAREWKSTHLRMTNRGSQAAVIARSIDVDDSLVPCSLQSKLPPARNVAIPAASREHARHLLQRETGQMVLRIRVNARRVHAGGSRVADAADTNISRVVSVSLAEWPCFQRQNFAIDQGEGSSS